MNKLITLLGALLLLSPTLRAQTTQAPPAPQLVARADSGAVLIGNGWYLPRYAPGAGADTTGALFAMFHRHRTAGWLFVIPYSVGMVLTFPLSNTNRAGVTTVADKAIAPPLGIPILAGTVVGFIAHANKFNKKHLRTVSQNYMLGQPVPPRYRQLLTPRNFEEAAYVREAMRQQLEREKLSSAATTR